MGDEVRYDPLKRTMPETISAVHAWWTYRGMLDALYTWWELSPRLDKFMMAAGIGTSALGGWAARVESLLAQQFVILGGTHRTAAILHICKSGEFGALRPATVVGENGQTVRDLYALYQRGSLRTANQFFRPEKAKELVESLRRFGYVPDKSTARVLRMVPDKYEFHLLRFQVPQEGSNFVPLSDLRQLASFVANGL